MGERGCHLRRLQWHRPQAVAAVLRSLGDHLVFQMQVSMKGLRTVWGQHRGLVRPAMRRIHWGQAQTSAYQVHSGSRLGSCRDLRDEDCFGSLIEDIVDSDNNQANDLVGTKLD